MYSASGNIARRITGGQQFIRSASSDSIEQVGGSRNNSGNFGKLPSGSSGRGSSNAWKLEWQRQTEEENMKYDPFINYQTIHSVKNCIRIDGLIRACARNDPQQVGYYVFKEEVDANGRNCDGRTPLHLACAEVCPTLYRS